jgi:uncharacterized membrane protein
VFGRSFGILGRNAPIFVPLGALAALPNLLPHLWRLQFQYGLKPGEVVVWTNTEYPGLQLLGFLLSLCVEAVVVYGAFQDMRGNKVRLGESFWVGLSRILPVIVASIGVGAVMGLGVLLLVIPGLIAMAMLYVTIPVCVVERLGPFKSMDRSASLTKGYRWKVFGVALLPALVGAIVIAVISAALRPLAESMALVIGQFLCEAFLVAYQAIVAVVTYHDLRVAKEGVDIDRIAAVFD